jgi:predicted N-acetyltransferase YhbS
MNYHIRPATADDQARISKIVRAAGINPTGLRWRRFLVAEAGATIIGTVQLKPHRDGTVELASLTVLPGQQGAGIGGALVRAAQERGPRPLYLTCISHIEGYYQRLGFRRVAPRDLPRDLGRIYVAGNVLLGLTRQPTRVLVMRC